MHILKKLVGLSHELLPCRQGPSPAHIRQPDDDAAATNKLKWKQQLVTMSKKNGATCSLKSSSSISDVQVSS